MALKAENLHPAFEKRPHRALMGSMTDQTLSLLGRIMDDGFHGLFGNRVVTANAQLFHRRGQGVCPGRLRRVTDRTIPLGIRAMDFRENGIRFYSGVRVMTIGAQLFLHRREIVGRLDDCRLGMTGKTKLIALGDQQAILVGGVGRMTLGAFSPGKRLMNTGKGHLGLERRVAGETDRGFILRFPEQILRTRGMRIMTGGAFPLLYRRMHGLFIKPGLAFLMTGKTQGRAFLLQDKLVGKSVPFMADLAVPFCNRRVDKGLCMGSLGFLVTIVTGLSRGQTGAGPCNHETKQRQRQNLPQSFHSCNLI